MDIFVAFHRALVTSSAIQKSQNKNEHGISLWISFKMRKRFIYTIYKLCELLDSCENPIIVSSLRDHDVAWQRWRIH